MFRKLKNKYVWNKATDVYGNKLKFCTYNHNQSYATCKKYVISKKPFNFKKWSILMILLSSAAFFSEMHNMNMDVLKSIFFLLVLLLLIKLRYKVKEESLLVIPFHGIQLNTTYISGRKYEKFILRQNIKDIVLNEAITVNRVFHYLALILRNSDGTSEFHTILPLFQKTMPGLDCLDIIYNGVQSAFHIMD